MIAPNCPDHGRLALDLALGRLDDETAARAEVVRTTCPVCREWWRTQLEGDEAVDVDVAVVAALDELELPTRRRGHGWLAVAATVVMTLGVGSLWLLDRPANVQPGPDDDAVIIANMDFEVPEAIAQLDDPSVAGLNPVAADDGPVIASLSFEEGVAAPDGSEPIYSGGFEDGVVTDWVPST